jgi:hypothetical protein
MVPKRLSAVAIPPDEHRSWRRNGDPGPQAVILDQE